MSGYWHWQLGLGTLRYPRYPSGDVGTGPVRPGTWATTADPEIGKSRQV
jgi:hypothetical protein